MDMTDKVIILVQRHPTKLPYIVAICDNEAAATQLVTQYWAGMSDEQHAQRLNYFQWQFVEVNTLTQFRPGNGSR